MGVRLHNGLTVDFGRMTDVDMRNVMQECLFQMLDDDINAVLVEWAEADKIAAAELVEHLQDAIGDGGA